LGIVDKYLANQMNEAVKAAVQLQLEKLKEEAHAKNEDFINKIDENIKKIIKEQVKVKLRSKSPRFCQELRNILATYGDTATTKRRRDDEDNDEEPSAGSNWGSKRRRSKKQPESSSEPKEKSSKSTGKSVEGSRSH
nr:hypothetical protein [Tanacetum cinerariifolium]